MVFSGEEEYGVVLMGNGLGERERIKPPFLNFHLPYLKWGSRRYLECQKISDNGDDPSMVSRPKTKMSRLRIDGGDDRINVVCERLLLDLKVEGRKIKDAIMKE